MSGAPDSPATDGHPLAGVLDRLLARERGGIEPAQRMRRTPTERSFAVKRIEPAPEIDAAKRRMLVIAALGSDGGDSARRSIVRWALRQGRHPAALDIGCVEELQDPATLGDPDPVDGPRIPLVNLPSAPERLRDEPAELLVAMLDRLRRHEAASDLLVVRIAPRFRMALMRAVLLGGGLVVPLENTYEVLYEAFRLSREVLEGFLDLTVWPLARDRVALERYQALVREVMGEDLPTLEQTDESEGALLGRLAAAPAGGFLVSLVDPDTAGPPSQLLQTGSLQI